MDGTAIAETERTEIEASHAIFEAAPSEITSELGLRSEFWDDSHFSMARGCDSAVFNRLHLPNGAAAGDQRIARAVAAFREAGVAHFFVQVPPCDAVAETERQARAARLKPYRRAWVKFWRKAEPVSAPDTQLHIVAVDETNADAWGAVTARNFGMSDVMGRWFAAMARTPRWHACMSLDGDTPVGGGVFYVASDDTAWFGMGSTSPAARGRGGQTALLARRINDAATLGVRWMVVETGAAIPGEPQTSYDNIERAGFRAIYARPNWGEASD